MSPKTMSSKRSLLLVLALELVCAGAARWRMTNATLKTNVEYQLGQEVIASENWRRDGALARHFIPSRSVDQSLPEWSERDIYWRDYLSQPPLSFMLLHGTSRLFDTVEPVFLGKLLAQAQIAVGVLLAGVLLYEVFGFGATLAGLTFLIWGNPFLVWFIDGYFATTPAMVCQLVLASWCARFFKRELLSDSSERPSRIRWADVLTASTLAYLGTLSEWVALFGNVVAGVTFFLVGTCFLVTRSSRAWKAYAACLAIGIGSVAGELTTVLLYGSKVGYAFYWDGFMGRVALRSGESVTTNVPYSDVLIRQLHFAWPHMMLVALVVMLLVVVLFAAVRLAIGGSSTGRAEGGLLLSVVAIGLGSGVTYCLLLKNLVSIHWWFAGTWAIGWTMVVCAFAYVVRDGTGRIRHARASSLVYTAFCTVLTVGIVGWNLQFIDLAPPAGRESHDLYRTMGRELPRDGAPLVVFDHPNIFAEYPHTTAYLRRPVVRYGPFGGFFKLGTTEDAAPDLLAHRGFAYVAYDPSMRQCAADDVTPAAWQMTLPVALCRVPVERLVTDSAHLFREVPGGSPAVFEQWVRQLLTRPDCCDSPEHLLEVTRLLDSRLRLKSGDVVERIRAQNAAEFRALVTHWHSVVGGHQDVTNVQLVTPFLLGILAKGQTWSFLLANLESEPIPEFRPGMNVLANSKTLSFALPFQIRTSDGRALLPVSFFQTTAVDLPSSGLTFELFDFSVRVSRTSNASIATLNGVSRPSRNAVLAVRSGCAAPPTAPTDLRIVSNSGGAVVLAWTPAGGDPTSYVLEAGSASGLVDITARDLGGAGTTYNGTEVKPGTYYSRIRAKNACGTSLPSNEIVVAVR